MYIESKRPFENLKDFFSPIKFSDILPYIDSFTKSDYIKIYSNLLDDIVNGPYYTYAILDAENPKYLLLSTCQNRIIDAEISDNGKVISFEEFTKNSEEIPQKVEKDL